MIVKGFNQEHPILEIPVHDGWKIVSFLEGNSNGDLAGQNLRIYNHSKDMTMALTGGYDIRPDADGIRKAIGIISTIISEEAAAEDEVVG